MRIPSFLANVKESKQGSSVPAETPPDDLPEPLDAELPAPPAIVGVRGRRLLCMIGIFALLLRLILLPLGHCWVINVDYNLFIDLFKNHPPYDTFTTLSLLPRAST